jgi:hypothetical protein
MWNIYSQIRASDRWMVNSGAGCLHCEARYDSGLVSQTRCSEVRWIQVSQLPETSPNRSKHRKSHHSDRLRKPGLGLRSNHRRLGEPWASRFRSNGWQHTQTPRAGSGTQTEANHPLEGFHCVAYVRDGWYRLLYSRGSDLPRAGHLLRSLFGSPRNPPSHAGRFDKASNGRMDATDGPQSKRS